MKVATKSKSAQAEVHGESFEQVKQRFALWRVNRKSGEHISNALWAAAVGVAQRHGLQRTAQELRIDYGGLKKRLERDGGAVVSTGPVPATEGNPRFVELFAPAAFGAGAAQTFECVVEMENARGGKMRVELRSLDGLAGLAGAFWSAQ